MAERAQSVEPAFGTLERWLHIGRFLLRRRDKARTELGLVTLAFNLNRLTNLHGAAKMQAALASGPSAHPATSTVTELHRTRTWHRARV